MFSQSSVVVRGSEVVREFAMDTMTYEVVLNLQLGHVEDML